MMKTSDLFELLFSRLAWPSALTRERACVEIAKLCVAPEFSKDACDFLIKWLAAQHTETHSALAILVLIRARMEAEEGCLLPTAEEVEAHVRWPSLQSWLLLAEYQSNREPKVNLARCHSGEAPSSFSPRPFFNDHIRGFVPPIYEHWAKVLETEKLIPFRRQWSFEWETVLGRHPVTLSTDSLQFWISDRRPEGHLVAMDAPMSEIYRSAYLRTLAWAIDSLRIRWVDALWLAAETVPINLDLWNVRPSQRPRWWPRVTSVKGPVDTSAEAIFRTVEQLWVGEQSGTANWGADWSVAHADGRVHDGQSVYDLSIRGFFQKRVDGENPSTDEVFQWLASDPQSRAKTRRNSPVRLGLEIEYQDPQELSRRFGGWSLIPAAAWLDRGGPIAQWQWWRRFRGLQAPSACLTTDGYRMAFRPETIEFSNGNQVIGRWSDWTDGLSERQKGDLPPASGHVLLVNREAIREFAAEFGANFCWLVRVHVWFRKNSYDDYEEMHVDRAYGIGNLILP
jgi:hypothetical protein